MRAFILIILLSAFASFDVFASIDKPRRCGMFDRSIARDIYELGGRFSVRAVIDIRGDIARFCNVLEDFKKALSKFKKDNALSHTQNENLAKVQRDGQQVLETLEEKLKVISIFVRIDPSNDVVAYKRLRTISDARDVVDDQLEALKKLEEGVSTLGESFQ